MRPTTPSTRPKLNGSSANRTRNNAGGIERMPPQNLEAEQSTLGSMFLDKIAAERVLEILVPEDFYREAHERIFAAMLHLSVNGMPVDFVTVSEELRNRKLLDAVGGAAYLTTLLDAVPTAANADYYARIVEEKAILRRLIEASHDIAAIAYGTEEYAFTESKGNPVSPAAVEAIDQSESLIYSIRKVTKRSGLVHISQIAPEAYELLTANLDSKEGITGLDTGFEDLNYQTSGLQPSDLIIVAGRPSMGKTAFSLSIGASVAKTMKRQDRRESVAIFSLEMSQDALMHRMFCSEAGVSSHRLRTGFVRDADYEKLTEAFGRISELPIYIDDDADNTVLQMKAKARRVAGDTGLSLIIVDYMQLIMPHASRSQRFENRNQELTAISRALKGMAKEFNVPVIALSQLSRAIEKREDKRPILSDLRESGAIEAEADLVAFIHRPSYYERGKEKEEETPEELDWPRQAGEVPTEETEIIIAKHRNGPVGTVKVGFQPEFARFVNYSRYGS